MIGCWCAVRRGAVRARGFSLIEALIALVVLLVLVAAVGDAVSRTLHVAAMSTSRAGAARTISELGVRLSEEGRSAAAVFIPVTDVLGNANAGDRAHEVDFFRRLSGGGDAYVAYRLDSSSGVVTRYEYMPVSGAVSIVHADEAAAGIAAFAPVRAPAGSMADVVDAGNISNVSIGYGRPGVVGGNDVITVTMQAVPSGDVMPAPVNVHLASQTAPTNLSVLVPAQPPPPVHGGPIRIPFVIRGITRIPHAVWHFGDPADGEFSGIHQSQVFGEVQYYGPGDVGSLDWWGLLAADPTVESGSFSFIDSSGARVTIAVSCDNGIPCPRFRPLPTSGNVQPPAGGVAFDASP